MASDPNPDQGWYFNTRTKQVEHLEKSRGIDLLGPYPDEATARRALDIVRERNKQADGDANWSDD
ncbi:hypothetical protein [Amycolatopsis sp. H20-H5]|uniref:hypothetical protein n=1 Tax=Amycolatopsis sp. H20-H5 TaxID=3046309 RepID=UPI002DB5A171|nr:hypothetical protein [Amycolatopsis sp. H20-H5]MEC3981930.1 hypothetical protein [Amycolatopsis sp. H20-H5]